METQVSASVSGEGGLMRPFLGFIFSLMQPGKQLSATQITCQSDDGMKIHFTVEMGLSVCLSADSRCVFVLSFLRCV